MTATPADGPALALFGRIDAADERLLATVPVYEFIRLLLADHFDVLRPTIERMLRSVDPDVARAGARLAGLAALYHERAADLDREAAAGDAPQRRGLAEVAAANIALEDCRTWCEVYLAKFFNDADEEVRKEAAATFRQLKDESLERYESLIIAFADSVAAPGREAAIDFTHASELGVTIAGVPFPHLLFEFVLSYSGWTWTTLAFGETFEALAAGVQGALWALGGVPEVLRSDNLSAATHELKRSSGRDLTARFRAVLEHYALRSSRITPGQAHENGVVEQANGRVKALLAQALLVRGHADFSDQAAYEAFVQEVVAYWRNRPAAERLVEERARLRPLPSAPIPSYTVYESTVRRWSTIRVAHRTYSVPARLMGHTVEARVYADVVEVRYRGQVVQTMPRLCKEDDHHIDYRHVIGWLVRKPGAFARYRYREDLFPGVPFRRLYDRLQATHGERGDVEYLRILKLALRRQK